MLAAETIFEALIKGELLRQPLLKLYKEKIDHATSRRNLEIRHLYKTPSPYPHGVAG